MHTAHSSPIGAPTIFSNARMRVTSRDHADKMSVCNNVLISSSYSAEMELMQRDGSQIPAETCDIDY